MDTTNLPPIPSSAEGGAPPKSTEREALFQALLAAFKESLRKNWGPAEVAQHPHGRRLVRLVRATFEQRQLYPQTWRVEFVRHLRTLHSMTGYREIRALLFDWLQGKRLLPENADVFVFAEPRMRRHVARLANTHDISPLQEAAPAPELKATEPTVLTIDNPETSDRDDALSFRANGSEFEIGVHTPILEAFAPKGSTLDEWACEMAVSAYMPHLVVPMLPHELAEAAGLNAGAERFVLSFYFTGNGHDAMRFQRACCETIHIGRNASYDEVGAWLAALMPELEEGDEDESAEYRPCPPELPAALRAWATNSQQLEQQRLQAGGRVFDREQVDVLVDADGVVKLRKYSQASPAHKLISEWMIAANQAAARFCAQHDLPCLYRVQETGSAAKEEESPDPANNFVRPQLSLTPAPHADLGVDCYSQITSPLRRYGDLMMQRQIISFLQSGAPAYSADELWSRGQIVEATSRRIQKVEAKSEFYYKCMYLTQNLGMRFAASISHSPPPAKTVTLIFPDLGLRLFVPLTGIKGLSARQIPPFDVPMPVLVKCLEMDAHRGTMVFKVERDARANLR